MTEQTTPLYRFFKQRYPGTVGSEHLGETVERGGRNGRQIRNEDVTRLRFSDASLDFILSFDVLEHVPDYRKALEECFRCLPPGGKLFFSVPFERAMDRNLVRARVLDDGSIEHLLPPEYHGDPLRPEGCLCFHHFGWQLLDEVRETGFSDVTAVLYWAPRFGYLGGEQIQFLAAKGG